MATATTQAYSAARSFLFVPGNRPAMFAKAASSGADVVVLDLEDSVPDAEKASARDEISAAWQKLAPLPSALMVRMNTPESAAGAQDIEWLQALRPAAIMVPKAESGATLAALHARLEPTALIPLIESAAGHAALAEVAAAPGVLRLAVGHIDFMADTGIQCDEDQAELAPLRFAVAMATRINALAPAIDGVTVQVDDVECLERDTRRAVRYGFGAKLCIHPRQVAVVHSALAPTDDELAWAKRVVAADRVAGGAAIKIDGKMVDLPVVLQARRLLARAAREVERVVRHDSE